MFLNTQHPRDIVVKKYVVAKFRKTNFSCNTTDAGSETLLFHIGELFSGKIDISCRFCTEWKVLRSPNGVRHAPSRPLNCARGDILSVTLSGASKTRSRKVSTFRNIHPCDSHGFPLTRPSGFLGCAIAPLGMTAFSGFSRFRCAPLELYGAGVREGGNNSQRLAQKRKRPQVNLKPF